MFFVIVMFMIMLGVVFVLLILMFKSQKKFEVNPYECGVETTTPAWEGISIPFFKVGVVFIIFDLEVILLYQFVFMMNNSFFFFFFLVGFLLFMYMTLIVEWSGDCIKWSV